MIPYLYFVISQDCNLTRRNLAAVILSVLCVTVVCCPVVESTRCFMYTAADTWYWIVEHLCSCLLTNLSCWTARACVVRKYNMTILLLGCLRERRSEVNRHSSPDCPVAFICLKNISKKFSSYSPVQILGD